MIFTYWNGDSADVAPFLAAWLPIDPSVAVYGDDAVRLCLARLDASYAALFDRIRIAACKSDVARLVLLHEHGGFYMDAHGAPQNATRLDALLVQAVSREFVMFDEPLNHVESGDIHILTGALAARRGSITTRGLIHGIFHNLKQHAWVQDHSTMPPPYNIFVLSGPWALRRMLMTPKKPYVVKTELDDRVEVVVLSPDLEERPFLWYTNYGYRRPGQHWSERQKTEPLFE